MILSAAVIIGLAAGVTRAWVGKRPYRVVSLKFPGLVFFAFIPQWITFYQSRTGSRIPDEWAVTILISSQVLLLVFAWLNRKQPGFWLLGAGLALNFLVIVLNGGLMPISPGAAKIVHPDTPETRMQVGERLGNGKDVVLQVAATRVAFLSDRYHLPGFFNRLLGYQIAFSIGDVLIALGAFWLLWSLGGQESEALS